MGLGVDHGESLNERWQNANQDSNGANAAGHR